MEKYKRQDYQLLCGSIRDRPPKNGTGYDLLFKKTMFVVGALVAATMSMHGAATAAPHRSAHFQRVHALRSAYRPRLHRPGIQRAGIDRPSVAARGTGYRLQTYRERLVAAGFAPVRYGARFGLWHSRATRGYAWRRPAFRRAFAAYAPAAPLVASAPVASGVQTGRASFYGGGGRTAAGGRVGAATCAHRWLPFGTRVLVTNLANAHRMILTVNDRGPFAGGRVIDVSVGAAGVLGMLHSGTAPVRVQVVGGPG